MRWDGGDYRSWTRSACLCLALLWLPLEAGIEGTVRFRRLSVEDGLSQVFIDDILQDHQGFMWIATQNGLNRYDGERFRVFSHLDDDPTSLINNAVHALYEDGDGYLWIATDGGLDRFDPRTEVFTHYRHRAEAATFGRDRINAILPGGDGSLWLGTNAGLSRLEAGAEHLNGVALNGSGDMEVRTLARAEGESLWIGTHDAGLLRFDPKAATVARFAPPNTREDLTETLSMAEIKHLLFDRAHRLWIATEGSGLFRFDPDGAELIRFSGAEGPGTLPNDSVWCTYQDARGRIWVGTEAGLSLFDEKTDRFETLTHDPLDPFSLGHEKIRVVYQDSGGVLWVGTQQGLNTWDTSLDYFISHRADQELDGLHDVSAFYDGGDDTVWIATAGGLSTWHRDEDRFSTIPVSPRPGSLLIDHQDVLWVGTFTNGLGRMAPDGETLRYYRGDPDRPDTLGSNSVISLFEDNDNQLWVGCFRGGLNAFDRETETFRQYRHDPDDPYSLGSDRLRIIRQDIDGRILVGTEGGLSLFNRATSRFQRVTADPENTEGLSGNKIWALHVSDNGDLWIGDGDGYVHRWRPADRKAGIERFQRFGPQEGLPRESINGIVEGNDGALWITALSSVIRLDPVTEQVRSYDINQGLISGELIFGAAHVCKDGMVLVGSADGFSAFYPENVRANPNPPRVQLTDYQVLNSSQQLQRRAPESSLTRPIHLTSSLVIPYTDYVFGFDFAALHYAAPEENRYAYMLEGLDETWISTDQAKSYATYTTLRPGDYTFRVRAANADGIWSEQEASIEIRVQPPPWRTWWAYTLYGLTILGLIGAYILYQRRKLAQKMVVIERLRRVDKLKDDFLANTSHELRTPLNGIIGLTESLIDGVAGPLDERVRTNLEMVVTSGRRLATLVDDILDFSKLENRSLDLQIKPVDMWSLAEVVLTLTAPLAERKEITLINDIPEDLPPVEADENRLLQIMHNLVGNAVKFTDRGQVRVSAVLKGQTMAVTVADTGIGIPPDQQELIFGKFNQVADADHSFGGTGLGLAITRQLVLLHGGEISVSSQPGQGSEFTFTLPLMPEGSTEHQTVLRSREPQLPALDSADELSIGSMPRQPEGWQVSDEPFHILIVDDEMVNRKVLVNYLAMSDYVIHEADSGRTAMRLLLQLERVDLVILDIMMPHMSGYQVCRELRTRFPMHELPILFLTAKNQLADLVDGFESGANDYLTKPVAKQELLARVDTHLRLLDITRTLEQKVNERTSQLAVRNEELETLDRIVKAINRELELRGVLQAVLDQGITLFPQTERGVFMVWNGRIERFEVAAATGREADKLLALTFAREELMARYTENARHIGHDVYLVNEFAGRPGTEALVGVETPESLLAMVVRRGEDLEGFLVLDNFDHRDAFDDSDLRLLEHFRGHVVSAVAKARFTEELRAKNEEILLTQQQLALREKMASLGTLTAGVAHEIRNPLNFINNFSQFAIDFAEELADLLARQGNGPIDQASREEMAELVDQIRENGQFIHKHGQRAAHIVRSMMELSRGKRGVARPTDINAFVREHVNLAREGADTDPDRIVAVDFELGEDVGTYPIVADSLGRVLINLVTNALEAVLNRVPIEPEGFEPRILLSTGRGEHGFEIRVSDNGPGITDEDRARIFTPFFTTKPNRDNIGLGLAVSYDIVTREHGGELIVETEPGKGTEMIIAIPDTPDTSIAN